ncbi:hypothetical protein H9P43_003913 [Blastocladiella emersonii ATCC 22665]|nr:hypothetical protein H9P43_003913 [Blastocladiella emersonii ATCC 22665]
MESTASEPLIVHPSPSPPPSAAPAQDPPLPAAAAMPPTPPPEPSGAASRRESAASPTQQPPRSAPPAHPPLRLTIPALADPDLSTDCAQCGKAFSTSGFRWWTGRPKVHCVHCGLVCCRDCADTKVLLRKFGYVDAPQRVCVYCRPVAALEALTERELAMQPVHALRAYVNAYQVPGAPFLEKSDLVAAVARAIANPDDGRERQFRARRKAMPHGAKFGDSPTANGQRQRARSEHTNARPGFFASFGNSSTASSSSAQQQQQAPPVPPVPPRPAPASNRPAVPPGAGPRSSGGGATTGTGSNDTSSSDARSRARSQPPPMHARPGATANGSVPPVPPTPLSAAEQAQIDAFLQNLLAEYLTRTGGAAGSSSSDAPPAHRPNVDPDLPSIKMLAEANADPANLSIRALKGILAANHVDASQLLEKSELVAKVRLLIDEWRKLHPPPLPTDGPTAAAAPSTPLSPSQECKVCMENPIDCVLLECGHVGVCSECANQMHDCPFCRERITRVVHTFHA